MRRARNLDGVKGSLTRPLPILNQNVLCDRVRGRRGHASPADVGRPGAGQGKRPGREGTVGAAEDTFVAYVLDQLGEVQGLGCRAMFGGHGLYRGPTFFGIVFAGRLYLKTDDATVHEYTRRGMAAFHPNDRQLLKTYYEVPADVLEEPRRLAAWAEAAAGCADRHAAGVYGAGGRGAAPGAARVVRR